MRLHVPSLTPVCLAALITGEHPAGSRIPSMTWYHRGERRFIEYGSSLQATLAEGTRQMVEDVLVNYNLVHLNSRVETVFESLEDAGLVTAAVNTYACRGRVRHPMAPPGGPPHRPPDGHRRRGVRPHAATSSASCSPPNVPGAPRNFGSSVDRHGGHVARWLVTRDGFDFLFLYLYETDAAGHRGGDVLAAVERADAAIGLMVEAAGGLDGFLDRYSLVVVADHGQSQVEREADAAEAFEGLRLFRSSRHSDAEECDLALAASNRVAMAYVLPGSGLTASEVGHRLARHPASDVVMWREGAWFAARRGVGELRFRPGGDHVDDRGQHWSLAGDRDLLPDEAYPNALERIAGALGCPTAGDVIASARLGWEYVDSGGVHHAGAGSHGSLHAADSLVPLITAGFDEPPGFPARPSITDITPLVRSRLLAGGHAAAVPSSRYDGHR